MNAAGPGTSGARQRGFTLLEAIVALVVFTMGAFALYGWLSTNVITLDRIRERQQVEADELGGRERGAQHRAVSGAWEVYCVC